MAEDAHSAGYAAVRDLFDVLVDGIAPAIKKVLDKAWAKKLIDDEQLSTAMAPAFSSQDKARHFLSAILPRIDRDRKAFDLLLGILFGFATLRGLAEDLKDTFKKIMREKTTYTGIISSDSGMFSEPPRDVTSEANLDVHVNGACGSDGTIPPTSPKHADKSSQPNTSHSNGSIPKLLPNDMSAPPILPFDKNDDHSDGATASFSDESGSTFIASNAAMQSIEESTISDLSTLITTSASGHFDASEAHMRAGRSELQRTISLQEEAIQAEKTARVEAETARVRAENARQKALSEKEQMEVEVQQKESKIAKIKQNVEDLKSELKTKDEEVKRYKDKIADLEKENQNVQNLQNRIRELEAQLVALEGKHESAKKNLEDKIQNLKEELEDANSKVKERGEQLLELKTKIVEHREERVALKEIIVEMKDKQHQLECEKYEVETKLKEEELKNERLEHENTKRNSIDKLKRVESELQEKLDHQQRNCIPREEHEDKLKRVESELQNCIPREEHDAKVKELTEKIEKMQSSCKPKADCSPEADSTVTFDISDHEN